MTDVHLTSINSVWIRVEAEPSIIMELSEEFTFYAENYKWSPKFKARVWDGKIRLVNTMTRLCRAGLAQRIKKFCDSRGYTISWDEELYYDNISEVELRDFIASLNIPEKFQNRDYQFESILKCIRSKRRTLESPTSSGKSLMIYIILRWYEKHGKQLVIVPRTGLVKQMADDFRDYGYTGSISLSTDGLNRNSAPSGDIVISTWQTLNNGKHKMPKGWYKDFRTVFGDEAHSAKAMCTIQIMESLENCPYRFGTTGTLDDQPLNVANIEGLFGPRFKTISTKQLMDAGYVSKLQIKCIVLNYSEELKKTIKGMTYHDEVKFLTGYGPRNNFISNLALSLSGNKLLFFKLVEHGKLLFDKISAKSNNNVFYIDGGINTDIREDIRKAIEDEENATLIASMGTTSTGISIKKLHHMIAGHPSKAKIAILQAIGRMLRQHESKDMAYMYDIVDNLSIGSYKNYTLNHFNERLKIYSKEEFDYKIYNVNL